MSKLDVYRSPDGRYWMECQNDLLRHLNTRFVVPLASPDDVTQVDPKLNPLLDIEGDEMIMLTHFASAIRTKDLGRKVGSAGQNERAISAALDLLISGA